MNKRKIIIYGAGEHGHVIKAALLKSGYCDILGFIDDNKEKDSEVLGGKEILYSKIKPKEAMIALGIGNINARHIVFNNLTEKGYFFSTVIDPSAEIYNNVRIGIGSYVGAKAIVHVNSEIGIGCVIDNGAIISHDCKIKDFSEVSVGTLLGGGVSVNEKTFLGMGSVLRDHIKIGSNAVIGAGSVVTKDIPSETLSYGVPAKIIRSLS